MPDPHPLLSWADSANGLWAVWEIVLGVVTTAFGGVWWLFRVHGTAKDAHRRISDMERGMVENVKETHRRIEIVQQDTLSHVVKWERQRQEDIANQRREIDGMSHLLSEMRDDIKTLLTRK